MNRLGDRPKNQTDETVFIEFHPNSAYRLAWLMTFARLADKTCKTLSALVWSKGNLQVDETPLAGLLVLTPKRFGDERGFFCESWNERTMASFGANYRFVQDNHSLSSTVGTLRGLHCQVNPNAQAKLVRCGRGSLYDVAVDIRAGSPTFGQWYGAELSFENGRQLMIPAGFLHGFVTREPDTEIVYKCTDFYAPEADRSVRFDDPDIGIDWALHGQEPILSQKDTEAPLLRDLDHNFEFEG